MLRPAMLILAICCLPLSGCGTFSDAFCGPVNDHVYYRGVRLDVEAAKEGGPMTLMIADIPFSAVADTLLIPLIAYGEIVMPRSLLQQMAKEQADAQTRISSPTPPANPIGGTTASPIVNPPPQK